MAQISLPPGVCPQCDASITGKQHSCLNGNLKKMFFSREPLVKMSCWIGFLLLLLQPVYSTINYSGNTYTLQQKQQARQNKAQLDRLILHAQAIGVPASLLQPILKQEQSFSNPNVLLTLFNNQLATNYYQNQAKEFHTLLGHVSRVVTIATNQIQLQAQQDMQIFQTTLSKENLQGFGNMQYFLQQFNQDELFLESAQTPRDYNAISTDAHQSIYALNMLQSIFTALASFNNSITRLNLAHLDTTALQTQLQNDMLAFNNATSLLDLENLNAQVDAQNQQVLVNVIQAFPYISAAQLSEMETQIHLLHTYGIHSIAYQNRLNADQVALKNTRTIYDDQVLLNQIDTDLASMRYDLEQGQARYLVKQFHHEVDTWAKANPYYDRYDGKNYALDDGYMSTGIGSALDSDLASAGTIADFEAMIAEANNALFDLHMFEADYKDHSYYNQIHATDLQMISHYNLQNKQVLMVSLAEQVMRVYQNGKLLRSFYVTTGRQELPSPPGVWKVLSRRAPIIFEAAEPKGSPYWFPDTPISYAILYHYGGDFVHDAPWRASFGPGTQFPHLDASGNTAYNFDGSHGCINLSESDAAWVYMHTNWNTMIVVY